MNTMSNLAKGVLMGDGAVAAFLDLTRVKNVGVGLFESTTDNLFRKANTIHNAPRTASYYSTQVKLRETPMSLKRYFAGDIVPAYNVDGLDIGWAYTTDVNEHRLSRGYSNSSDFDNFQRVLRERYFGNAKDTEAILNPAIKEHKANLSKGPDGNKYQRPIDGGLFEQMDFSLPKVESELELFKPFFNKDNKSGLYNLYYEKRNDHLGRRNYGLKNGYGIDKEDNDRYYSTNDDENKGWKIKENEEFNIRQGDFKVDSAITYVEKLSGDTLNLKGNIVKKTQALFHKGKIKSIISRFGTESNDPKNELSRGRNLKKANNKNDAIEGYNNPYCRVWTVHHQYSTMKDRIRPFIDDKGGFVKISELQKNLSEGMRPNGTEEFNNSVLQDNGFVRITPQIKKDGSKENIKRYMFSIENLAWKDNLDGLSEEQTGPNKGRIMWFPPYNLKFSENVNVNWNANNFIGRGEQIYTYTNTERSGTLDFTLLIDHPSILNEWRASFMKDNENKYEQELLRFFAGCEQLEGKGIQKTTTDINSDSKVESKEGKIIDNLYYKTFVIYFPNAYSGKGVGDNINNKDGIKEIIKKLLNYETSSSGNTVGYIDKNASGETNNVNSNSLLNKNANKGRIAELLRIDEGKIISAYTLYDLFDNNGDLKVTDLFDSSHTLKNIKYYGGASSTGTDELNNRLSNNRKNLIKKIFENSFKEQFDKNNINEKDENKTIDVQGNDINSIYDKQERCALVCLTFERNNINPATEGRNIFSGNTGQNSTTYSNSREASKTETVEIAENANFQNEYLYFSMVENKDEKLSRGIIDAVKYFNPAFHSLTPEGFNSRLTFLHQCTRQGATNEIKKWSENASTFIKHAGNLAFGRAPYCILRIGDFFNTKICIDSMSISYDNGGGVQWDLNPEGAGVQPMFANISINFKFLGGQDIAGPVERLQNAISSNYYANASIYDNKANTLSNE